MTFSGYLTKLLYLISVFTLFMSGASFSQEWIKSLGGSLRDWAYSVYHTSDGGLIVAGGTSSFGSGLYDVLVVKLDQAGNVQWQKTYGGTHHEWARSIKQTNDGGYIFVGPTVSFGAGGWDVWVVKLDSNGNIQWQKTYGGPLNEFAYDIKQTSSGGYIIAGKTQSFSNGGYDVWVIKLDSNGNILWQKSIGGASDDEAFSIQQTNDGGYIVGGRTNSFGSGNYDIWVIKLDTNGNIQWQKTYGGSSVDGGRVFQISNGNYLIAGATQSFGAGNYDIWIVKIDPNGNIIWQKTYGGPQHEWPEYFHETSGSYVVMGITYSYGAGGRDIWILKLDFNGNIVWQKTYGGTGDDGVYASDEIPGGFILAGMTWSFGSNGDVWVLKVNGNGDIPTCTLQGTSNISPVSTSTVPLNTNATAVNTSAIINNTSALTTTPTFNENFQCFIVSSNNPPIIRRFFSEPMGGIVPLNVHFHWFIHDPDGDPLTCYIDVDSDGTDEYIIHNCPYDATPSAGVIGQTHVYNIVGIYTATLRVEDGKGGMDTKQTDIRVYQQRR